MTQAFDVTLTFTRDGQDPVVISRTVDAASPVAAIGLAATQILHDEGSEAVAVPNLTECHAVINTGGVPA